MLAKANDGSPGRDDESFEDIESTGLRKWLNDLRKDLHDKTYRPQPVKRVMIEKPGGGERPLGIPTIRDRVAQTAAKLVLEPIFEADLEPNAYGYRPRRSAQDAIRKVDELLYQGYTDIVDADLSKYFDTIPHSELLQCVARRVVDKHMLHLLKMWLKVPVEERDEKGKKRLTGGKDQDRGTPQGGVISPLLAASQSLHEPDVEGMEADWTWRTVPGAYSQLRGRLRDTQSRKGEGVTGVDARCTGAAGPDTQRKQDEHSGRPEGTIRFSGIYIRTALQSANGAGVYRLQSVEEECE